MTKRIVGEELRFDRSNVDRDLDALHFLYERLNDCVLRHATSNRERHQIEGRSAAGEKLIIKWRRHQQVYEATIYPKNSSTPPISFEFTADEFSKIGGF